MKDVLPWDYSRCVGKPQINRMVLVTDLQNPATWTLHPTCNACRRREPGHPERQIYMAPALEEDGTCVNRIE